MLNRKNRQCRNYILQGSEKHKGYAGGYFYGLAKTVIAKKGSVIGAAYMEDFSVKHIEIKEIDALDRIIGVRYAESQIDEKLKVRMRSDLQAGRQILFSGLPCQIKDVQRYLEEEYEGFYTVAIGCVGAVCSKIWKDYLAETQSNGSVITEIHCPYRGKFGISQTKILVKFSHGTAYFRDEKQDKLLLLKKAGLIFKEECYGCSCGDDLHVDLFLETYYEERKRDILQENGLTQVSIFTDKGMQLFLDTRSQICFEKEIKGKKNILSKKIMRPEKYSYFWKYYNGYGFTFASDLILLQEDTVYQDRFLKEMLMKYVLLDAKGITLEKILDNWGLDRVIIYGHGALSDMIVDKLKNSGRIYNNIIIDENFDADSIDKSLPILVTTLCFIPDIMEIFKEKKLKYKRLLSLDLLIKTEYENKVLGGPDHTIWDEKNTGIGDIFLITGAQFENKGAQSMLFVTVNELRRKYADCDIYYLPVDSMENYPDPLLKKYRFHIIREGREIYGRLYGLLPQLRAIIDVSGYALASKWNCSHFIEILMIAKNNDIPIYYMPQSFGPFDFSKDWDQRIKEGLAHADIIFAREKNGYDLLLRKYALKNVRMSEDLVLQNKEIDLKNIYLQKLQKEPYKLKTGSNIAIIPNIRTYEFGDKHDILEIYRLIISRLIKEKNNIYILAHSDDGQVCNDIYNMFSDHENVFLYKKEIDCLEYSILVQEFQYIIASRYHAIIHAYKKCVPCIAIGWAEKYRELLTIFGQEKYMFDVRLRIDGKKIIEAIDHMGRVWIQEKEKIKEILPTMQKENCFDAIH